MTEDMLDQNVGPESSLLLDLGSTASLLRAKTQSASLLSDMESFKAANPGSIFEDFIRWFSPRDLIETEELEDHSKKEDTKQKSSDEIKTIKVDLSSRMKIADNIWVDMWRQAKPVAAERQRRLFDDTTEAEKVRIKKKS